MLPRIDLAETIDAYETALTVNLTYRELGLQGAREAAQVSRYQAANEARKAVQMDTHLADILVVVSALLRTDGPRHRGAGRARGRGEIVRTRHAPRTRDGPERRALEALAGQRLRPRVVLVRPGFALGGVPAVGDQRGHDLPPARAPDGMRHRREFVGQAVGGLDRCRFPTPAPT